MSNNVNCYYIGHLWCYVKMKGINVQNKYVPNRKAQQYK